MISALVPAFNEAGSISRVVRLLLSFDAVSQVVVVDDASSDDTASLASEAGADVFMHKRNQGKTQAVLSGIDMCSSDNILLFDADLEGFTQEDFDSMRDLYELVDMVVADYGAQHVIIRYVVGMLPATSGVRLLSKQLLVSADIGRGNVWAIEGLINRYCFTHDKSVAVYVANNLFSPRKESKYGRLTGAWLNLRSITLILLSLGLFRVPLTLLDWWRFRRLRKAARSQ